MANISDQTIETLRASLVALSSHQHLHFQLVADQLDSARAALMAAEGVDYDEFLQAKEKIRSQDLLKKQIAELEVKKQGLLKQIDAFEKIQRERNALVDEMASIKGDKKGK